MVTNITANYTEGSYEASMSHHKGLAKPVRASFKQVRMSSNDRSENMHACIVIQIEETACTCMCITNIPCSGGSA